MMQYLLLHHIGLILHFVSVAFRTHEGTVRVNSGALLR